MTSHTDSHAERGREYLRNFHTGAPTDSPAGERPIEDVVKNLIAVLRRTYTVENEREIERTMGDVGQPYRALRQVEAALRASRGETPERDRLERAIEAVYRAGLNGLHAPPADAVVVLLRGAPAPQEEPREDRCPNCGGQAGSPEPGAPCVECLAAGEPREVSPEGLVESTRTVLLASAGNLRSRAKRGLEVVPDWAAEDLAVLLDEAARALRAAERERQEAEEVKRQNEARGQALRIIAERLERGLGRSVEMETDLARALALATLAMDTLRTAERERARLEERVRELAKGFRREITDQAFRTDGDFAARRIALRTYRAIADELERALSGEPATGQRGEREEVDRG